MLDAASVMEKYAENIAKKRDLPSKKLFGKAILAGAMIAFGAAGSNVAAHGIADVGLARVMAGIVFPVGLMMVVLLGAELFTGDCMLAIGVPEKILSIRKLIGMFLIIYIGNFVGGLLIASLNYLSGQLNYSKGALGAYTIKVAIGKVNLNVIEGISSGILCNVLVCAAVLMAMCACDITGKLMASFFVIFAFVVSGYEHCVANMYYITAGLLCKGNPTYVVVACEKYGFTAEKLATLNLKTFLVNNLVPVTIGNIIGGAIFVGIPLYYLNVSKQSKMATILKEDRGR